MLKYIVILCEYWGGHKSHGGDFMTTCPECNLGFMRGHTPNVMWFVYIICLMLFNIYNNVISNNPYPNLFLHLEHITLGLSLFNNSFR